MKGSSLVLFHCIGKSHFFFRANVRSSSNPPEQLLEFVADRAQICPIVCLTEIPRALIKRRARKRNKGEEDFESLEQMFSAAIDDSTFLEKLIRSDE